MREDLEQLKQRIPLLQYLQRRHWTGCRVAAREEFVGLCPLHRDTRPSFYVNARKNLFYCHGCQRGGDLIRFVELSERLSFRESLACLEQDLAQAAESEVLTRTTAFFQLQLHRSSQAVEYLHNRGLQDPDLIAELGLGYAPGGNLRRHLADFGYSFDLLLRTGLINDQGRDAFCRRVIFPCCQQGRVINLYGRSIGAAFPHRLLPRARRFSQFATIHTAFALQLRARPPGMHFRGHLCVYFITAQRLAITPRMMPSIGFRNLVSLKVPGKCPTIKSWPSACFLSASG
jgi:DNA primase